MTRVGWLTALVAVTVSGCKQRSAATGDDPPPAAAPVAGVDAAPAAARHPDATPAPTPSPLDAAPIAAPDVSCSEPGPRAALCPCLTAARRTEPDASEIRGVVCERAAALSERLETWVVRAGLDGDPARGAADTNDDYWLVEVDGDRRRALARLASKLTNNAIGAYGRETFKASVATERAGSRTVWRVTARRRFEHADRDVDVDRLEISETLCVDGGGALRCPVQAPTRLSEKLDVGDPTDAASIESFVAEHGRRPPIRRGFRLSMTIGDDGAVAIARVSGSERLTAAHVGVRRLW